MLKVEMVGSEMIKPASPTPLHLRFFDLTSLDLLIPPIFVHVILYYPSPNMAALSHLKASLSHCLLRFYPLAGSLEADAGRVDCNDQGVEFVESRVGSQLQDLIQNPESQALSELVPCHDNGSKAGRSEGGLLAMQANFFDCGGLALGVCLCHSIGDMATFAAFLKHWSSVGSKPPACDGDRVVNCLRLFPPAAGSDPALPKCVLPPLPSPAMKRFSFSDASIAALRKNRGGGASRVEAVTGLVCRCIARAAGKAAPPGRSEKVFIVTHSVNLRRRMEPPLPDDAFGNLCATSYTAELPEEELFKSRATGEGGGGVDQED